MSQKAVKIISLVLIGVFFASDPAFAAQRPFMCALSAKSPFNPIVEVVGTGDDLEIIEDEETLKRIKEGFITDAAILYYELLKDKTKISRDKLKKLISKHLKKYKAFKDSETLQPTETVKKVQEYAQEFGVTIPPNAKIILHAAKKMESTITYKVQNEVLHQLWLNGKTTNQYIVIPFPIPDGDTGKYKRLLHEIKEGLEVVSGSQVIAMISGAPFKGAGLDLLDKRDSGVHDGASLLLRKPDGKLLGTFADGEAWMSWFEQNFWPLKDKRVVLIGAGPVGAAITKTNNMSLAKELVITDAEPQKARVLVKGLREKGVKAVYVKSDDLKNKIASKALHDKISQADVVINAGGQGRVPSPEVKTPLFHTKQVPLIYKSSAVAVDLNLHLENDMNFLIQASNAAPDIITIGGIGMMIETNTKMIIKLLGWPDKGSDVEYLHDLVDNAARHYYELVSPIKPPIRDENEKILRLKAQLSSPYEEVRRNAAAIIMQDVVDIDKKELRQEALKTILAIDLPRVTLPRIHERQCDLHCHTCDIGDGYYPSTYQVYLAFKAGLSAFSIINHDSLPQIEAIEATAIINDEIDKYNKRHRKVIPKLMLTPGFEMTTFYNEVEVHIVTLIPDFYADSFSKKKEALKDLIEKQEKFKNANNKAVIKLLDEANKRFPSFKITIDDINELVRSPVLIASSISDRMFYKYKEQFKEQGINTPREVWYKLFRAEGLEDFHEDKVKHLRFTWDEAMRFIKDSGAKFIIAHPNEIKDQEDRIFEEIVEKEIPGRINAGDLNPDSFLGFEFFSDKVKGAGLQPYLGKYGTNLIKTHPFYKVHPIILPGLPGNDSHGRFTYPSRSLGLGDNYAKDVENYTRKVLQAIYHSSLFETDFYSETSTGRLVNVGHRGALRLARENTLASFEKAIEVGADEIEFDIHLTKDGQIVVVHDPTLERISEGRDKRFVSDITLAELRNIDIGSTEFPNQRIPTLEEVIDLVNGRVKLQIEIKQVMEKDRGISKKLVELLLRKNVINQVLIASFYQEYLEQVKKENSQIKIGLHVRDKSPVAEKYIALARELNLSVLLFHIDAITHELVEKIQKGGILVSSYNINDYIEKMGKAIKVGLDRAGSNMPNVFKELLFLERQKSLKQHTLDLQAEAQWGQTFIDDIRLRAYEAKRFFREGKIDSPDILVGLDTSLIPKEQRPYIQGLLNKLSRLSREEKLDNIIIRRREGTKLAAILKKEAGERKIPNSNIIILGDSKVLEKRAFDSFREGIDPDKWAFFAKIEMPEDIDKQYIRLFEMLTISINLAFGKSVSLDNPHMQIIQQGKRIFKFIPAIEPYEYELLQEIYKRQLEVMIAV